VAVSYDDANVVQRALRRFVASGPGSWIGARLLHRLDRPVHRLTRGRHTLSSLLSGLPLVMLTTTGARSGRPHTVPLLGLPTPDGVAVIASNFGQRHHPAWYHNLRADPSGEVVLNGVAQRVVATEAAGEERERIWRHGLSVYPGWDQYERRAPHRRIAVFVLRAAT
jgi:deazaflavin-dependent oxidoreductase (nitroreductase family)